MTEAAVTSRQCPLHVERHGAGPELVLVHGWGLHGGIWHELVEALQGQWRVSVVDLPGHGDSADCGAWDLDDLARWLGDALPGPRIWIGWSLGAMACMQLALARPGQVRALGLVAATPRFTSAPDWPHATRPELLQAFAEELRDNPRSLLLRFLGLQVQGAEHAKGNLKALREQWTRRPPARLPALESGLDILRRADLRPRLADIRCPALVIAGDQDRLVPPRASEALARALPRAQLQTVPGAGHAPFVAQPQAVARWLGDFLHPLPSSEALGADV